MSTVEELAAFPHALPILTALATGDHELAGELCGEAALLAPTDTIYEFSAVANLLLGCLAQAFGVPSEAAVANLGLTVAQQHPNGPP